MSNSKTKKDPASLIIAGTNYDRRRKVTKQMFGRMKTMEAAGKSTSSIASTLGVSPYAVKYNTNKKFRQAEILRKSQNPTGGNTKTSPAERLAYKTNLIKSRKKVEKWVK